MAIYLLNFVKSGTPHKQQLAGQARKLLEVGLWGIPPTSPASKHLQPGGRVVVYVGAPERVFIGDAVVDQEVHTWGADEAARYPMGGKYNVGISLKDVAIWDKPVLLKDVWPELEAAAKNPDA